MEPEDFVTMKEYYSSKLEDEVMNKWSNDDSVEFEMSEEAYNTWMEECRKFENRQHENKFIKRLRELVFNNEISDEDFRKFVKNYVSAGGLDDD